jgi:hypothetical protein
MTTSHGSACSALTIALAAGFCVVLNARAEPNASSVELRPRDFAYGRLIQLPEDGSALLQVELPVDVYRNSRTPGLQDVLVFNALGAQVPHALRAASSQPSEVPQLVALPLFPVPLALSIERVEMAVAVERSAAGQVLRITSRSDLADGQLKSQPIAAYLLDARALPRALLRLRFELTAAPDDLVLPVSVETSADLITWRSVEVVGALLHLKHAEHSIEQAQLELAPTRAEFLRVRPQAGGPFPVSVSSVSAELVANAAPRRLSRVDAIGRPVAAKSGVYRFDLGGAVPVERLELALPEDNIVIAAELWSAQRAEGPYQRVLDARFYRIVAAGKALSGPSFEIARMARRYYELRVDTTRPGLGGGRPRLLTYHAPDQLLFLRRGDPPFTLAYGRYGARRLRFEADDLLALVPTAGKPTAIASLLPAAVLGGVALLDAPKPAPPYTTYALWSVLLCGVALLAALAYRLVRSND